MRFLHPTLMVVVLTAGFACSRRPTPAMPAAVATAASPPATRLLALALLRGALEQDGPRLRVRLPGEDGIALSPGQEAGTWRFRCRCYAYVPASTLPWVYEATGIVDPARGLVRLSGLTPPPELPTGLLPSPVAVLTPIASPPLTRR